MLRYILLLKLRVGGPCSHPHLVFEKTVILGEESTQFFPRVGGRFTVPLIFHAVATPIITCWTLNGVCASKQAVKCYGFLPRECKKLNSHMTEDIFLPQTNSTSDHL